ncbi:MAG: 2-oxo acid dehydrogenase subunit E2 [Ignavibacteriales bacterium]|nr:2-oxo acid dehydrogenase subunit E2 [Ignavibacteriales bacterium]
MIVDINLPVIGDNIPSADVIKVNVKEGEKINVNDVIIEIETDKATVEVPSEISGIIKKVFVQEGKKAKVGEPIISVEVSDSSQETKTEKLEEKVEEKEVEKQTTIQAQIDSSKSQTQKEHTHMPQLVSIPRDIPKVVAPAAPSVRRFAREIGIDIHNVRGSGKNGRISIEDVKAYAKNLNQQLQSGGIVGSGISIAKETLPDFSKFGEIDRQPMNNVRRKTAEHLSYAWATIPHVTQFDKADITELEKIRKQFSKQVESLGGKLTITAILLKVVSSAMKVFPQFNSSVDMEKNEIIYKKYFNVGVAVDTEKGLLVPVIKDVDKKNITQLSVELAEISQKARDKKLSLEDMQGGCFTISNLGGIGGTYFTPIVNSPEVAILGVSKSSIEPIYIDGEFRPKLMMPLSLSYDHRIIDGADGIRFLRWIVNALENPFLLSLEG